MKNIKYFQSDKSLYIYIKYKYWNALWHGSNYWPVKNSQKSWLGFVESLGAFLLLILIEYNSLKFTKL